MSFVANFSLGHLLDLSIDVVVAFVLATLIGAERQWRQRSAGLRTNVLVAVGAAAFVSLGMHLNGNARAAQIAACVVSGIGFLGAGVIMKEGAACSQRLEYSRHAVVLGRRRRAPAGVGLRRGSRGSDLGGPRRQRDVALSGG